MIHDTIPDTRIPKSNGMLIELDVRIDELKQLCCVVIVKVAVGEVFTEQVRWTRRIARMAELREFLFRQELAEQIEGFGVPVREVERRVLFKGFGELELSERGAVDQERHLILANVQRDEVVGRVLVAKKSVRLFLSF